MDVRSLRRPAIDLLSGRGHCLLSLETSPGRNQSSYRRTKQYLNIKPDSSFLLNSNSPPRDHIIFNPPSSAPSVLHTPLKFLPKEDKRRQLLATTAKKVYQAPSRLPPPLKRNNIPHHHLADSDIAEMQRLKREEPDKWNNLKLSRKFNCSSMFVSICLSQCGYDDTITREVEKARLQGIKDKWGPRRRMAHEDKLRRNEMALRGE